MKNYKNGFTIIELIFVIVIIGILASVAIVRLSVTRDDAKVANCVENITIYMRDISGYYTSQGNYALNMSDMSNVEVYETTPITSSGDSGEYYFICDKTENITPSNASITFKFSKVIDGMGNLRTNLNATVFSTQKGTVDGDLGYVLDVKHIASEGTGVDHAIIGLRIKR